MQATFKVLESLWKLMKIEAIRRNCTVATLAEEAFESALRQCAESEGATPKRRKNGDSK